MAVAGGGSICQVDVGEGDEYIVHPRYAILFDGGQLTLLMSA